MNLNDTQISIEKPIMAFFSIFLSLVVVYSSIGRAESALKTKDHEAFSLQDGRVERDDHVPAASIDGVDGFTATAHDPGAIPGSTGVDSILWSEWLPEYIEHAYPELLAAEPDFSAWCDTPPSGSADRAKFYSTLIWAMVKHESDYDPNKTYRESFRGSDGDHIVSRGLLQLSRDSATAYGCDVIDGEALHDPRTNLDCGLRILTQWVIRDQTISGQAGTGRSRKLLGASRYWAVLRSQKIGRVRDQFAQGNGCPSETGSER